jgi:hypothetical protein
VKNLSLTSHKLLKEYLLEGGTNKIGL